MRLGAEAGLPEDEVAEVLAGDRFAAEVRAEEEVAASSASRASRSSSSTAAVAAAGAHPAASLAGLLSEAQGGAARAPGSAEAAA